MIPVEMQVEPSSFNQKVQQPGKLFLQQVPRPRSNEWIGHSYWQKILPEMRIAYRRTCAYCAQWIPHGTGRHSVDHFLPRYTHPELAYEWKNFRYVSARFNSRKSTREILDPFQIEQDWFMIDFSSFFIRPNPDLPSHIQQRVKHTIQELKLNDDEDLVRERQDHVCCYCLGEISLSYLERRAPFIAYELKRQGLVEEIKVRLAGICTELRF